MIVRMKTEIREKAEKMPLENVGHLRREDGTVSAE